MATKEHFERTVDEDDTNRERTGPPVTEGRHDRGLSTESGFKIDGNGNTPSGRERYQLGRLRRDHARAEWRSEAERTLAHGCTEIARMVGALDDTSVAQVVGVLLAPL